MNFAVGYPVDPAGREPLADLLADYRPRVAEIYLAWPGEASGRPGAGGDERETDALRERVCADVATIRSMGVKIDLLFNAACYGGDACAAALERRVADVIDRIGPPDVVTTTSPAVAFVVRTRYPGVEVRASVNMKLGTVAAMDHLDDLFDSYYIQRDVQRDLAGVRRLRQWADRRGKSLCLLANSGCLRDCAFQSFHDNLIAHADEARRAEPIEGFEPLGCRRVIGDRRRWEAIMQATWIRPEDLHHYASLVDVVKLATRTHDSPRLVLDAYVRGRFHGNLLDLLEPGYGPLLAPAIIDNDRIDPAWFDRVSTCDRDCPTCDDCRRTLEGALVRFGDT